MIIKELPRSLPFWIKITCSSEVCCRGHTQSSHTPLIVDFLHCPRIFAPDMTFCTLEGKCSWARSLLEISFFFSYPSVQQTYSCCGFISPLGAQPWSPKLSPALSSTPAFPLWHVHAICTTPSRSMMSYLPPDAVVGIIFGILNVILTLATIWQTHINRKRNYRKSNCWYGDIAHSTCRQSCTWSRSFVKAGLRANAARLTFHANDMSGRGRWCFASVVQNGEQKE